MENEMKYPENMIKLLTQEVADEIENVYIKEFVDQTEKAIFDNICERCPRCDGDRMGIKLYPEGGEYFCSHIFCDNKSSKCGFELKAKAKTLPDLCIKSIKMLSEMGK